MSVAPANLGARRWNLAALMVLIAGAVVAPFTSARGEVVADSRLEHLVAPAQFLQRHASVWDDNRTLGEPTSYFSPALGAFQALVGELGAAPWVVQRATHALLLALAAAGAHLLARRLVPHPAGWLLAGFLYAFNPYTSQFLLPSGLFVPYAVAPWLALAALTGVRSREAAWRWAAVFAIAVFCVGALNPSSLVLATIPAAAMALISLAAGWTTRHRVVGWVARTGVLTAGVSAAALVVLALGSSSIRTNLETTETPETVAASSSAAESWRGLGQWLSYLRLDAAQVRDQAVPFFDNGLVIVCTFVPLVVAGYALAVRGDRLVAGLAATAALSVVVMVGIHPPSDPTPLGSLLGAAFDRSLFARGFRSTYKAGAGLQLAVALLAASTVSTLMLVRARTVPGWRSRVRPAAALVAVVAVTGVASFPFWTGELYPSSGRHRDVPVYWDEAFAWFRTQPSEPGVLILPSLARTQYRWGFVNDTLFDASLSQPAVSARTLPQSTPVLAELTEAIEQYTAGSASRPGALGPILRRMGVRWVLVQNDVDWLAAGVPRPITYDTIRDDDDFALVAEFGRPGTNVIAPVSFDTDSIEEAAYPPVQVYEVLGSRPVGGVRTAAPVVVAGGPEAWPALALDGWLDHPLVLAAQLGATDRRAVLDGAAAYVITDGAQRRAVRVTASQSHRSQVLASGEDTGRPVATLSPDPADQTVATYGDLASIDASDHGRAFSLWDQAWRPGNAMDRDPETAWASEGREAPTLDVALRDPTRIDTIRLDPFVESDEHEVEQVAVTLWTAGGEMARREVEVTAEGATLLLDGGLDAVVRASVTVARPDDYQGLLGLRELELTGPGGPVDGREVLRVPGPPDVAAEADLVAALGDVEVHHVFTRQLGAGGIPEESVLRRSFWAPDHEVAVTALVRVDESTSDRAIDAMIDSPLSIAATGRFAGSVDASARNLVDGDFSTTWRFVPDRSAEIDEGDPGPASDPEAAVDPEVEPAPDAAADPEQSSDPGAAGDPEEIDRVTMRLPSVEADRLDVLAIVGADQPRDPSRVRRLVVRITDHAGAVSAHTADVGEEPVCDAAAPVDDAVCIERISVMFDRQVVNGIDIEPTVIDEQRTAFDVVPVQIAEVELRLGERGVLDESATRASDGCRPLLALDGVEVEMRPDGPVGLDTLAAGVSFVSCAPMQVGKGWHELHGLDATARALDTVSLAPTDAAAAPSPETPLEVVERSSTTRELRTRVRAGDLVVTDVPDHRGWKLSVTGAEGRRTSADGFVAWRAESDGPVTIDLRFGPQRWYKLAWLLSACTLAACMWLAVPRWRASQ